MTAPENHNSADNLINSPEIIEETMHFFRQLEAQSQIESLSDANGWGIHPRSHEYNILGEIAIGDRRPAADILCDTTGLQETPLVLKERQLQFDWAFDERLVRVGAEKFVKLIS